MGPLPEIPAKCLGPYLVREGGTHFQGLLEKWDGGSIRARESSSSYAGHPAHPNCRSPPGSSFNSVPRCENKGSSGWGEERVSFFLIVYVLFSLNTVINAGKFVLARSTEVKFPDIRLFAHDRCSGTAFLKANKVSGQESDTHRIES